MSWACGTCWRRFTTFQGREQHMDALDHSVPEHECDRCSRYFNSRSAVVNHMDAKNHWYYGCSICNATWPTEEEVKEHKIEDHYYCRDCDRDFYDHNSIKMHFNSRVHRGYCAKCPFCGKSYTSATGLSHHLEGGSCPQAPFLNRDEAYKLVRFKDTKGLISKNLIEWNGSPQYEATTEAWNGYAFKCYICHGEFRSLQSLNQHLGSPVRKFSD
ncbi:uncharacterized protein F4812DRAFT_426224 [Daldinia caldariorum]|uniref:uncharacterized protein n=1 Tax=Daldinia caldariorum TaxID=326644 RepID=UPI002007B0F9|nr:uncharacterized protein F4812DRAFT_426224 [Daldinia caldariorum]KAI1468297.1 hypothetical protein F4812DRAFT_426224 [Daldinia caldariorum]